MQCEYGYFCVAIPAPARALDRNAKTLLLSHRRQIRENVIRGLLVAVVAVSTAFLGGCGEGGVMSRFMLKPDRIIVERRPDPVYDRLFPYYVELCATSQFRSKLKGEGGVAGHAVMYLKIGRAHV